ncbi:unnamed protein product, partial [Rotaria sp. Silwood1]
IANIPLDSSNSNAYIKTIEDFCHGDIDIDKLKGEAAMVSGFF